MLRRPSYTLPGSLQAGKKHFLPAWSFLSFDWGKEAQWLKAKGLGVKQASR